MTTEQFIQSLPEKEKEIISSFRKVILTTDKSVSENIGKFMSSENAICYNEDGVFKYGLTLAKNHVSFHSLVMYANPQLMDDLKKQLKKVKFQKGCINFKSIDDFPVKVFEQHMKKSSQTDFSPMIAHYKKKKGA